MLLLSLVERVDGASHAHELLILLEVEGNRPFLERCHEGLVVSEHRKIPRGAGKCSRLHFPVELCLANACDDQMKCGAHRFQVSGVRNGFV